MQINPSVITPWLVMISMIGTFVLCAYNFVKKFDNKLNDIIIRLDKLEQRHEQHENDDDIRWDTRKKDYEILIRGVKASLEALKSQGIGNGLVSSASDQLSEYLITGKK